MEQSETCAAEQESLTATLEKILELQNKNSRQLIQSLRENVNFQNQVRLGMQQELETLKEQQRGEQFTPILKAVATVCVEYRKLLADEALSKKTRRTLRRGDFHVGSRRATSPALNQNRQHRHDRR